MSQFPAGILFGVLGMVVKTLLPDNPDMRTVAKHGKISLLGLNSLNYTELTPAVAKLNHIIYIIMKFQGFTVHGMPRPNKSKFKSLEPS